MDAGAVIERMRTVGAKPRDIEMGLLPARMRKHNQRSPMRFEVAGIGFTINDPPILRSKKGAEWIGPAITTKFAVGDYMRYFHPIAAT